MKQRTKKISLLLAASMVFACVPAMNLVSAADDEQEIIFDGAEYSFDKFTLSYKDAQTADIEIAFSEDGTDFGEYQKVSFKNETSESVYFDQTVKAKAAKLKVGNVGLPKIELEQIQRYAATKKNVGAGTRGTEEKPKSMWNPGADNFAEWFDGTYDDNGNITNLGKAANTGLYHDALKDGKTENKSDAMIELNYVFDKPEEFAYVILYMEQGNAADFEVRVPDKDGEIKSALTKDKDFGTAVKLPSGSGDKNVFVIKAPINTVTNQFNIYWHNFYNWAVDSGTGKENSRVDMPEIGIYYYNTVYESEYVLYDGAEFTFDEPISFDRIVGQLPEDMWYAGVAADGTEVNFSEKEGLTGYFTSEPDAEIEKVKIRGYNAEKVNAAKLPDTLSLFGAVQDLAKAAYTADPSTVAIDGKAANEDLAGDTRAEYMDITKETGVSALFDGDTQYNSIHPYHTFVDADKDRLTLQANSSITVNLGKKSIIDTVSYYAGPQYTPKKYDVLISDTADFSAAKTALTKEYEVVEGRLSPFTNDFGEYYCAMHEDQNVTNAEGQYVKIVNDGVLKPESDHLVIRDEKDQVAVDTVMKNDAMMNKNVILAKELRILGAELITTVDTSRKSKLSAVYTTSGSTVNAVITNKGEEASGVVTVYAAVYGTDGVLKSVKLGSVDTVAVNASANVTVSDVTVESTDRVKVFIWTNGMEPVAIISSVSAQ